jgi:putative glycosyltransferase (TIGR04372 family)
MRTKVWFREAARVVVTLLKTAIGFVILGVCYFVRPVQLIRFGRIYTSRIGHLCHNLDNYLSGRRARGSQEIALFATDDRIANKAIWLLWRRQPRLYFTRTAAPVVSVLLRFFPKSPALIPFRAELHPLPSTHSASPPIVSLSASEHTEGKQLLETHGISRPFVCFHNRDSAYLNYYGSDGNFHDFRDFTFDSYRCAIEALIRIGYSVVRIGEIVEQEAGINAPRFASLTGAKRSDFSDVYVSSECQFFVGGSSGVSQLPRLFRKPALLVNYIPFDVAELSAWSAGSTFIPKKLYSDALGRFLRFREMAAMSYDIHYKGDFFRDRGLTVVDNSGEEIADAVVEMEARVTGHWNDSAEQRRLHAAFWGSLPESAHVEIVRDRLGMRVGSTFLERNADLI